MDPHRLGLGTTHVRNLGGASFRRSGGEMMPKKEVKPLKLMRVRARSRQILQQQYLSKSGQISEVDVDVVFHCQGGEKVKGHKAILATGSAFFADLFHDQGPGEISHVSVPDVPGDIMNKIILLTYKEMVGLSELQIRDIGLYLPMFSMALTQFEYQGGASPDSWHKFQLPSKIGVGRRDRTGQVPMRASNFRGPPPLIPSNRVLLREGQQFGNIGMPAERMYINPNHGEYYDPDEMEHLDEYDDEIMASMEADMAMEEEEEPSILHMQQNRLMKRQYMSSDSDSNQYLNFDSRPLHVTDNIEKYRDIPSAMKRPKLTPIASAKVQNRSATSLTIPSLQCSVCHITFETEEKWQWHEERHIGLGMFQCRMCDRLMESAVQVFDHERLSHNSTVSPMRVMQDGAGRTTGNTEKEETGKGRKDKLVPRPGFDDDGSVITIEKTIGGQSKVKLDESVKRLIPTKQVYQQRNDPNASGMKIGKVYSVNKVNTTNNKDNANNNNASEKIEEREPDFVEKNEANSGVKSKVPNWIYVCKKCEQSSESFNKAKLHYPVCYPDEVIPFWKSVVKYRLGYYGKSKCPLCVKKYCSNGGFLVHCTHNHPEYRPKFSNTADDKIRCVSCKEKFDYPTEFHAHLVEGGCDILPKSATITSKTASPGMKSKRTYAPPKLNEDDKDTPSPPKKILPSQMLPPRSARLAKRAQKLAEQLEESGSGGNFPPADCPICGVSQIVNVPSHLTNDHGDMDLSVNRISATLLRCRKCFITFALCDLLDHKESCKGPFTDEPAPPESNNLNRRASVTGAETVDSSSGETKKLKTYHRSRSLTPQLGSPATATPATPLVIPDHIGKSDVEDCLPANEVFTLENVRQLFECQVCGKKSNRIGVISDCYRSHSIYRCVLCFSTFDSRLNYSLHVKRCHAVKNSSSRIKCPVCDRNFINVGQTTSHLYVQHLHSILNQKEEEGKIGPNLDESVVSEADTSKLDVSIDDASMPEVEEEKPTEMENGNDEDDAPAPILSPPKLAPQSPANSPPVLSKTTANVVAPKSPTKCPTKSSPRKANVVDAEVLQDSKDVTTEASASEDLPVAENDEK